MFIVAELLRDGVFCVCSGVDFENIVYDAKENAIGVRMTVYIRPWILLTRTTPLYFFAMLELEDVIVVSILVQHYFIFIF